MPRMPRLIAGAVLLLTAAPVTGCECIDCNRTGPTVGYVRAIVADVGGAPVAGASIHIDNRSFITEPRVSDSEGIAVLLVYLDEPPSDTGTVTVSPPVGYAAPPPQPVTIPADDTTDVSVVLERS